MEHLFARCCTHIHMLGQMTFFYVVFHSHPPLQQWYMQQTQGTSFHIITCTEQFIWSDILIPKHHWYRGAADDRFHLPCFGSFFFVFCVVLQCCHSAVFVFEGKLLLLCLQLCLFVCWQHL